jgi:hypothetical protein
VGLKVGRRTVVRLVGQRGADNLFDHAVVKVDAWTKTHAMLRKFGLKVDEKIR